MDNVRNKQIQLYIDNTEFVDGLVMINEDQFLVSDWAGTIRIIGPNMKRQILIDTKPSGMNLADMDYDPERSILVIATFNSHRVIAYKINPMEYN